MTRVSFVISMLFWLCLSSGCSSYYSLQVGDPCPTRDYRSSCQPSEQCVTLGPFIRSGRLSVESVLNCGYTIVGEKICCPLEDAATTTTTTTTTAATVAKTSTTTTETPPWLGLFKTSREYVLRSVAEQGPTNRDSIIFPDTSTLSGAACQTPLYEGSCETMSRCRSLEPLLLQHRLRDDDVQTCRGGTLEEIICCPANLPAVPRGQVGTAMRICLPETTSELSETRSSFDDENAITNAEQLLPHYKHLAALAYPNAAHDGYVHSCTALVLTPRLLVSGAGCGRPSHAVFGVADMRDVDDEEDFLAVIDRIAIYRDDLTVLRLTQALPLDQSSAPHISLAPMCTQFEQTRLQLSGQLLATAWAKGNASDCPLYELPMRLLPTEACQDIGNASAAQGLPSAHLCVAPIHANALSASNSNSCAPCPAVVASVLHLRRPSGNRCVLGIATPTAANCDAQAMYYTSLLSTQLLHFVEQQQREKRL